MGAGAETGGVTNDCWSAKGISMKSMVAADRTARAGDTEISFSRLFQYDRPMNADLVLAGIGDLGKTGSCPVVEQGFPALSG